MIARLLATARILNGVVLIVLSVAVFLIPVGTAIYHLRDPNIRSAGMPNFAWKLHRSLTPKFQKWADSRLSSTRAGELSTSNISGTEWPLFGSVFYLWATESLQAAWEKDNNACSTAPREYARGAIEAATRLVIDPRHAHWVKVHWGEKYLTNHNAFYRMLLIAALTSHARLTAETNYLPQLKTLVNP